MPFLRETVDLKISTGRGLSMAPEAKLPEVGGVPGIKKAGSGGPCFLLRARSSPWLSPRFG